MHRHLKQAGLGSVRLIAQFKCCCNNNLILLEMIKKRQADSKKMAAKLRN